MVPNTQRTSLTGFSGEIVTSVLDHQSDSRVLGKVYNHLDVLNVILAGINGVRWIVANGTSASHRAGK